MATLQPRVPSGIPETIMRIGVAKMKGCEGPYLFHRVIVKNSTKYRWWPVMGVERYIELDPSEWREKFTVVLDYPTDEPGRPA